MKLSFDAVDLGDGRPSVAVKADEFYNLQKAIKKALEYRVKMNNKKVVRGTFEIIAFVHNVKTQKA
ncbi:MAG: hypothetical protein Q7S34_01965 [bacterium]|nr:hypothetical protein [bacterium]